MRRILSMVVVLCAIASLQLKGQDISKYQLTENQKVGTLSNMNNGNRELIGANSANTSSAVTDIGFDFIYMGKIYNSFSVNTNGVLRLGDEPVLAGANTYGIPGNDRIVPLAGVNVQYRYRIFLWWTWSGNVNAELKTSNEGKVHYKIEGNAPNRVLVVEWKDLTFQDGEQTARGTFQLKLSESAISSTNKGRIEFVYNNFDLTDNYRDFSFRTGFGVGPEQGNFVAINHQTTQKVSELNYVSGPVPSGNISFFSGTGNNRMIYRFQATNKPSGTFSDFESTCPAPNAITIRFSEDCLDEAGIAVYRKLLNQPDNQFRLVATLPPDARSFSDGGVGLGARYVYRFYLLGESQYADTYTDYETEPIIAGGAAFQAIGSGKWTNRKIWGDNMPGNSDDVEIGCARSVFVSADGNAQVRNLIIHKGSFLTIEDGVSLHVSGDFINNGVFNPVGSGRLVLNGNVAQSLTNNGQGVTDDRLFKSNTTRSSWNDNQTGQVAEKTLSVGEADFTAIKNVKVDITHGFLRDLSLYLITPNGTAYTLSRGRGQQGRNYDNVIFTETGQPLPPTVQNADLKGEFSPEESFADYSGPFKGTWRLRVRDDFTGAGGSLNTFELTLSRGGTNDLVMRNITVNNSSSGGVVLNSGIVVQSGMQLSRGVLHSSERASVLFEAGANCSEGNAASFIDGPVLKRGNTAFTFPLGNRGKWAPLTLENYSSADIATTFKAIYNKEAAPSPDDLEEALDRVSGLEYWDLHPTYGNPTVDIMLHWKDAEDSQIEDISGGDLVVGHFMDGQWKSEGGVVVNGSAVGEGAAGAVRAQAVNSFSPFTFASINGNNPLPVEWLSFTAKSEAGGVVLNWKTATELNNSHFEIERSRDAAEWVKIGSVEGSGTSREILSYKYLDKTVFKGRTFYRIKQVDYDGAFEYSSIAVISGVEQGNRLVVYPNPTKRLVTIENNVYPAELIIRNSSGLEVLRSYLSEEKATLALPDLAAGLYILELRHYHGIEYQRIVISQ